MILGLAFWGTDIAYLWYPNLSYGQPGASTLASWGTLGRSRGMWEHNTRHFGVQAVTWLDLGQIDGSHFQSFPDTLDKQMCFFHVFSMFIFVSTLGSASACLGLQEPGFGAKISQKQSVHRSWTSHDYRVYTTNLNEVLMPWKPA